MRLTVNHPCPVLTQMCVNPRNPNIPGLPAPRLRRVQSALRGELDQPGLVRVQFQPEPREPLAKLGQERPRILLLLDADDDLVRETHNDHITASRLPPPPISPPIQDIVQVNVRQQRGQRCPLRRTLVAHRPGPLLHDPRGQPLTDQSQDPFVRDPVPEKPPPPLVIKSGEEITNARIQHPIHPSARDSDR